MSELVWGTQTAEAQKTFHRATCKPMLTRRASTWQVTVLATKNGQTLAQKKFSCESLNTRVC